MYIKNGVCIPESHHRKSHHLTRKIVSREKFLHFGSGKLETENCFKVVAVQEKGKSSKSDERKSRTCRNVQAAKVHVRTSMKSTCPQQRDSLLS